MIAVAQRVSRAAVTVEGNPVSAIGAGLLALVGVLKGDDPEDAAVLARKLCELRVFEDEGGRMNRSAAELRLPILVVSQFTLCADLRKGRRPGFDPAAPPDRARLLLGLLVAEIERAGLPAPQGSFGATMDVELVNRGPATFLLDSRIWRKSVDSAAPLT